MPVSSFYAIHQFIPTANVYLLSSKSVQTIAICATRGKCKNSISTEKEYNVGNSIFWTGQGVILDLCYGATEEIEGYLDVRIRRRIIKKVPFSLGPHGNVKSRTMGHCGSGTIRSKVSE